MSTSKSKILSFTIGICLVVFPSRSVGETGRSDQPVSQLKLKLTPKTKTVRIGDDLEVRAEIRNIGTKALFIERTIYERCAHSPLQLGFEGHAPIKDSGPGVGCAADCMDDPKQPFVDRFAQKWMLLTPGASIGVTIRLDSESFPQLHSPGHWLLRGDYTSDGNLSASFCANNLTLDPKEVEKLPFQAWKGQSETKVAIVVVRP